MARDGLKILDSDMHLMEPVDLWERYIDSKFKSLAPRGLTSENVRDLRMVHPDGRLWGLPQTHGQRNSNQGHNFRKNQGISIVPMQSADGPQTFNLKPWT